MPATYNGIGTQYHGKKNIEKRPGPCPHCNRAVELSSYDTRLWFVIFFIPVFPLGRKRIIDYCPACTRHYVVDAQKWETAKQLEISGAMEEFRANPTPEGAIAVHQQLLKFHQGAQAAEFQKKMAEQYATSAKVQAYLGAALEHLGRFEEATPYFSKALELRPDLPEARIGLAHSHIRAGKLDEARPLLDFMEKQGAAQLYSLQPLETLAIGYQKVNRHAEALELFGRIQTELPHIGEIKGFRDLVKKSETAMGKKESILPKQKFSWKRFFTFERSASRSTSPRVTWRSLAIVGVILGLVALGLIIANENIRRHRKLYVVNAFSQPARIEIQGQGKPLLVRRMSELTLPEGHYHAVITGPVRQDFDFDIRSSYFSRWSADPLWLINVGGAALLMQENVTYSSNPSPGTFSFHYGKALEFFPRITHPFQELPDSLRMKSHETRTLVHLDFFTGPAVGAYEYELQHAGAARAAALAEGWLPAHPGDKAMLSHYVENLRTQPERLDSFLRAGLGKRPIEMEWHRSYQRLHEKPAALPKLTAEYDEMLAADPTNSALLYLCGRISADRAKSRSLFQRALESDSKNPYAHFGLGYDRMAAGDWAAARTNLARAVELSPDEPYFGQSLLLMRLALGEAAAVEQETRALLRKKPLDYATEFRLLETLLVEGDRDATLKEMNSFEKQWLAKHGVRGRDPVVALKRFTLYGLGDFAELEKAAANDKTAAGKQMLAIALIEQGRLDEALKLSVTEDDAEEKPWHLLEMSIACAKQGNSSQANQCLEKAIKAMENGNEDVAHAAELLSRATPPSAEELQGILLPPRAKAIYIAVLGQKFPQSAAQLFPLARKFNLERGFPYHLINRVTLVAESK